MGSSLRAGGTNSLEAAGNVILGAVTENWSHMESRSTKGLLSSSAKMRAEGGAQSVGSRLSGDSISIHAGDNLSIVNGGLFADKDITLQADRGDVILAAAEEYYFKANESKKSGFGLFSGGGGFDIYRSAREKTANSLVGSAGSILQSGDDLTIMAGRDITAVNAAMIAGNDVTLAAMRDVNLMPGISMSNTEYSKKTSGIGLSASLTKDLTGAAITAGYRSREEGRYGNSLSNSGTGMMAAGNLAVLAGENITMLGTTMHSGKDTDLLAGNDINALSAFDKAHAESFVREISYGLSLQAYQNVSTALESSIRTQRDIVMGNGVSAAARHEEPVAYARFGLADSDSKSSLSVDASVPVFSGFSSGGDMRLSAGNDVTMRGANALASGDMNIAAGGSVTIEAVAASGESRAGASSASGFLGVDAISLNPAAALNAAKGKDAESIVVYEQSRLQGENVTIAAGKDIALTGVVAHSGKDMLLAAGSRLSINEVRDTDARSASSASYGFDSSRRAAGVRTERSDSTTGQDKGGILIAGGNLAAVAGQDIGIKGSSLNAGESMTLRAGRDISITPGEKSATSSYRATNVSLSGDFGMTEEKIDYFSGLRLGISSADAYAVLPYGSDLSANGGLHVEAGRDLTLAGATLAAGGDIGLEAGNNLTLAAMEAKQRSRETTFSLASGVYAEARQNITGALRAMVSGAEELYARGKPYTDGKGDVSDMPKDAYAIYKTASSVFSAAGKLKDPEVSYDIGFTFAAALGRRESGSTSRTGVSVSAGNDLSLKAGQDLSMRGGRLLAGRDLLLDAGRDLIVAPALSENHASGNSAALGGTFGLGGKISSKGATFLGISASATAAYGRDSANSQNYSNAEITAGSQLTAKIGRDASLAGVNLAGGEVNMDIGRNLTLASVQDKSSSQSLNIGGEGKILFGIGSSPQFSGGASFAYTAASGTRVGTQASITGADGVNIRAGGDTHLEGSLIAAENGNLTLDTGSLSWKDISSTSVSAGLSLALTNNFEHPLDEGKREQDEKKQEQQHQEKKAALLKIYEKQGAGYWYGGVDSAVQMVNGKIKITNDLAKQSPLALRELDLRYGQTEQLSRATIGQGSIIIRDNPGQDLSGLNRDPDAALVEKNRAQFAVNVSKPFDTLQKVADMSLIIAQQSEYVKEHGAANILAYEWENRVLLPLEKGLGALLGRTGGNDKGGGGSPKGGNNAWKESWKQHNKKVTVTLRQLPNDLAEMFGRNAPPLAD
jgi:filamentous hemagglutinin